jgi:signal transduction histidine kinase
VVAADALLDTLESLDFPALALRPGTIDLVGINATAAKLLGDATRWLEHVHPSDRARVEEACRAGSERVELRATSDHLAFRRLQLELRRREDFTLGVLIEPFAGSSSEPELEALLEALPFEVWERDIDGVLIRQNATGLRNWGAKLGGRVEDMGLDASTCKLWHELNARALAGEIVSWPVDYEVGGKQVNYINVIAPVRDGARIRGVVGVNVDVTATREAERRSAELVVELSRSLDELAYAQSTLVRRERLAALGELAAVVAHEVRNPLAAIYNSLSTLKKRLTFDRDAAILFGIIEEEAARLNRTVSDLLGYVRPLQPDRRPEDLVELTREVVRQKLEATPQIESEVSVSAPIEPVSADAVLMRIALVNLVTNAVQAMPQGGKLTVTLSASRHGQRAAIAIAVRDTGRGIPRDVLPRVFEPFFTTRASGAGLGLAVVRRIVEAHDGVVTAESDGHEGTVFTVLLPCA